MAVNDIVKVTAVWQRDGNERVAVNDFYFKQNSVLVLSTPGEDVVSAFLDYCLAAYQGVVTDYLRLVKVVAAPMPTNIATYEAFPAALGTQGGNPLPSFTSLFVRLRSGLLTRRGRGGDFLPPGVEGNNDGGVPNAAYQTAVAALYTTLLTDMASISINYASWKLSVWSPTNGSGQDVLTCTPKSTWSHQVDRKLY